MRPHRLPQEVLPKPQFAFQEMDSRNRKPRSSLTSWTDEFYNQLPWHLNWYSVRSSRAGKLTFSDLRLLSIGGSLSPIGRMDRFAASQHSYIQSDAPGACLRPLGVVYPVDDRKTIGVIQRLEEAVRGIVHRQRRFQILRDFRPSLRRIGGSPSPVSFCPFDLRMAGRPEPAMLRKPLRGRAVGVRWFPSFAAWGRRAFAIPRHSAAGSSPR